MYRVAQKKHPPSISLIISSLENYPFMCVGLLFLQEINSFWEGAFLLVHPVHTYIQGVPKSNVLIFRAVFSLTSSWRSATDSTSPLIWFPARTILGAASERTMWPSLGWWEWYRGRKLISALEGSVFCRKGLRWGWKIDTGWFGRKRSSLF